MCSCVFSMGSGLEMTAGLLEGLSASRNRNSVVPAPMHVCKLFVCVLTTAFCVLADNRSAVHADPAAETC